MVTLLRWLLRGLGHVTGQVMTDPQAARRRMRPDPDWRRVDDEGLAARLGPRETIDPAFRWGRWKRVDPRLPYDGWRSAGKAAGLGLWVIVVAATGLVGWWRGRGPLAALSELDRFGEAFEALGREPDPGGGDP